MSSVPPGADARVAVLEALVYDPAGTFCLVTSDELFEWIPPEPPVPTRQADVPKATTVAKAVVKRGPKRVIRAVEVLLADLPDGRVGLGQLGQYLRRTDLAPSPRAYGNSA